MRDRRPVTSLSRQLMIGHDVGFTSHHYLSIVPENTLCTLGVLIWTITLGYLCQCYDPRSCTGSRARVDWPYGIRAMSWGPPPKEAQQNSKNNSNPQKFVLRNAQLAFDNSRNLVRKMTVGNKVYNEGNGRNLVRDRGGHVPPIFYAQGTDWLIPLPFHPHEFFF